MLASRSMGPSGRAASPTAPIASRVTTRSGRSGGSARAGEVGTASSAMDGLRREIGLDRVGEQKIVDAAMQALELGRADGLEAEVVGVELGLHPAGMRREHQD